VSAAKQQLQLLQAELDGVRIRIAAEHQAADTGRSSFARERAAMEEQRHGASELLRQLEAREDALAQAESELDALRSELRAEQSNLATRAAAVAAQARDNAAQAAALAAEREGLVRAQALQGDLAAKEARLRQEADATAAQKDVCVEVRMGMRV